MNAELAEGQRRHQAQRGAHGNWFQLPPPVAPHVQAVSAQLEAHCEYSRLGSGALGMAMTADGRLDGYWEAHINIWDVAAGRPLKNLP